LTSTLSRTPASSGTQASLAGPHPSACSKDSSSWPATAEYARKAALAELDDLRERLAGWQDVAAANGAQPREIARFARELGMVHNTIFSSPTHPVHLGATDSL